MSQKDEIPPPPRPTMPASPIARDIHDITERVMLEMVGLLNTRSDRDKAEIGARINQLGAELKTPLKRILDEVLDLKKRVGHLEVRVTAHDAMIARMAPHASMQVRRKKKKGARRAADAR